MGRFWEKVDKSDGCREWLRVTHQGMAGLRSMDVKFPGDWVSLHR